MGVAKCGQILFVMGVATQSGRGLFSSQPPNFWPIPAQFSPWGFFWRCGRGLVVGVSFHHHTPKMGVASFKPPINSCPIPPSFFSQFSPDFRGVFWAGVGVAPRGRVPAWPRPFPGGHFREGAAADPHPPGGALVTRGRGRRPQNHHLFRLPAHAQPALPQGGRGQIWGGAWPLKVGVVTQKAGVVRS